MESFDTMDAVESIKKKILALAITRMIKFEIKKKRKIVHLSQ